MGTLTVGKDSLLAVLFDGAAGADKLENLPEADPTAASKLYCNFVVGIELRGIELVANSIYSIFSYGSLLLAFDYSSETIS